MSIDDLTFRHGRPGDVPLIRGAHARTLRDHRDLAKKAFPNAHRHQEEDAGEEPEYLAHAFGPDAAQGHGAASDTAPGIIVAETEDREIGGYVVLACGAHPPRPGRNCEIVDLWVAPDRRGRGLGRALIDRAVMLADDVGAASVSARIWHGRDRWAGAFAKAGMPELLRIHTRQFDHPRADETPSGSARGRRLSDAALIVAVTVILVLVLANAL